MIVLLAPPIGQIYLDLLELDPFFEVDLLFFIEHAVIPVVIDHLFLDHKLILDLGFVIEDLVAVLSQQR